MRSASSTTLLVYEQQATSNRCTTLRKTLPLIPLSPLFQLSREYKKVVAQTKETLLFDCHSTGKEGQEQGQLLERDILEKRLAKATEKLDRLSTTLPSIQRSFLNDFNIYDVAKEIAHINSSLFRLVSLTTVDTNVKSGKAFHPNDTPNTDEADIHSDTSGLKPLLDFHHYLSNAFAHQIIIETGASSSSTPTTTTSRNSTRKRKYCIIAHFIHIASILLSIYRDFSGCMAILACLQMPEIQRLHPLWAACPSKFTQSYKEMVKMLSPDNDYQTYYEQLKLHTLRFMIPNDTNTSPMIAVPFIQAHLSIIQKLIQQHAFVSPKTALSQSNHPHSNQHPVVLLSVAGQALASSALKILQFCQHQQTIDLSEFDAFLSNPAETPSATTNSSSSSSSSRRLRRLSLHRTSRMLSGNSHRRATSDSSNSQFWTTGHLKLSCQMCSDLNLIRSNANIYHWLVSRAYLTKQQLNMESVLIQPLGSAEMLPSPHLDEEEEEKALLQHWHLFRWSLYQKHYQQLQQQQRQQQEEEDEIKELDVSKPLSTMDSHVQGGQASSRTASSTVAVDDPCQEEADTRIKVKDRESLLQETNSNNNKIEKEEQIGNTTWSQTNRSKAHQTMAFSTAVDKNRCNGLPRQGSEEMTKHTIVDDEDEDSHTIIILAENDKEDWTGYASHHAHGTLEYKTSSTESTYPVDGKVTVEEEEDEEEEWTGYPVDVASQEEDDEDEIWRGYPIASDDEEDVLTHEHAVGKTKVEEMIFHKSNSTDLLSSSRSSANTLQEDSQKAKGKPTTPMTFSRHSNSQEFEEWKGYQQMIMKEEGGLCIKNNEGEAFSDPQFWNHTPAIGKAAARRMQQSLYTNSVELDRKRLPSSFIVSSSTAAN